MAADDEAPPAVIAPPGDGEQEADIAERGEKDGRAVQHGGGASVRNIGGLYLPARLALRGEGSPGPGESATSPTGKGAPR